MGAANLRPGNIRANSAPDAAGTFRDLREHDRIDRATRGFQNDTTSPAILEIEVQHLLGSSDVKRAVQQNISVAFAQHRGQILDVTEMAVVAYPLCPILSNVGIQAAGQSLPEPTPPFLINTVAVRLVATNGSIHGKRKRLLVQKPSQTFRNRSIPCHRFASYFIGGGFSSPCRRIRRHALAVLELPAST